MENQRDVTVYIPTRNRAALLKRAVESVLRQTYASIEIIVVVDHATDETVAVLEQIAANNPSTKTLRIVELGDRTGACAARNAAIERASGRFITGLDDDDYFLPDRVERFVEAFDPGGYAFAFSGYVRRTGSPSGCKEKLIDLPRGGLECSRLLRRNFVGNQIFTLTERLRLSGGFDEDLPAWQDYDLWIRMVRQFGAGFGVPGHTYVQDLTSASDRISANMDSVDRAHAVFLRKHPEYESPILRSYLRLGRATYGGQILALRDLLNVFTDASDLHLCASTLYFYVRGLLHIGR